MKPLLLILVAVLLLGVLTAVARSGKPSTRIVVAAPSMTGHLSAAATPTARVGAGWPPSRTVRTSPHRTHPSSRPTCTDNNWLQRLTPDERWIDERESTLNPTAREPSTGAYGLGQLLPSTYALLGLPMSASPCAQIVAQRAYLDRHYGGSWTAARTHWEVNRWW